MFDNRIQAGLLLLLLLQSAGLQHKKKDARSRPLVWSIYLEL